MQVSRVKVSNLMFLCKHQLHMCYRSKFDFRKLSTSLIRSFLIELTFFELSELFFQKFELSFEGQKAKRKFSDIPCHNIFELYSVLVQARFATSKTKLDIQYNKLGIRVAARLVEQLSTQDLRKLKLKFGNSSQKTHKSRCQTFLVLPNFTKFLYFIQNIFSRIVSKWIGRY